MRRRFEAAVAAFLMLAIGLQALALRPIFPPAHHTWTLVQHPLNAACAASASTCSITLTTSTAAGDLLIAYGLPGGSGKTFSTASAAAGTWVHPTGCAGSDTTAGSADIGYVLSSSVTAGPIVITMSAAATAATWSAGIVEYHFTSPPAVFDVCSGGSTCDRSTAAANLAGCSPGTITGSNDVVVQYGLFAGTASGCPNSGTSPADFPAGDAFCGLLNTTSNAAGTYTNTSGRAALGAAAFKETSATSTRRAPPMIY